LHFAGRFTADVSTYNNTDANFQINGFDPNASPLWNPTGSGDFSISAAVTAVCYEDGSTATTAQQDSLVGMTVFGMAPGGGAAGKLVDLDPDQQTVSQIWCLQVSVGNAISGAFVVAAFTDMWLRMPGNPGMEGAGAVYQSQLAAPAWTDPGASKLFTQLRAAAADRPLSIRFNLDAMIAGSTNPLFRTGRVVGTIGVSQAHDPQHVTRGRQLFSMNPGFGNAVAVVDRAARKVVVDLGNLLPVGGTGGGLPEPLQDNGAISVGTAAAPDLLGTLRSTTYTAPEWYPQTAGIVDLPAGRRLSDAELDTIAGTVLQIAAGTSGAIAQEQNGGQWVRADAFVYRLDPGEVANVTLYATSFGEPLAGASIACGLDPNTLNNTPASALPDIAKQPVVVVTDANGVATLSLTAGDPGHARAAADIDGQVYGVRPVLQTGGPAPVINPLDFISILIFSGYQIPATPTWWDNAQPILQQFANLYPVMKQQGWIDLGDYTSVASMAASVKYVLSLPPSDPGFMPVTRDLSRAKTQMLLQWLATTGGPNGGPNEGQQPVPIAATFGAAAKTAKELAESAVAAVAPKPPHHDHEHYPSGVAVPYGEKPREYDAED
jgi:hypothetical protein